MYDIESIFRYRQLFSSSLHRRGRPAYGQVDISKHAPEVEAPTRICKYAYLMAFMFWEYVLYRSPAVGESMFLCLGMDVNRIEGDSSQ